MRTIRRRGKIGIFWIHKQTLLHAAFPLSAGVENGISIDAQVNHVDFWSVLQKWHPELRDLGYEEVPRGRVVFLKQSGKFMIYLDKALWKKNSTSLILKAFSLAPGAFELQTDPHYTTDEGELRKLFDEC